MSPGRDGPTLAQRGSAGDRRDELCSPGGATHGRHIRRIALCRPSGAARIVWVVAQGFRPGLRPVASLRDSGQSIVSLIVVLQR